MVKILSQSGNSLADTYDVVGSVAGIDELETRELPIMHEMGGTLFSERFQTSIVNIETGDIAQNTNFGVTLGPLPLAITRLLGIQVVSDDQSRVLHCAVVARDPIANMEVPLWVFNVGVSDPARFIQNNRASTTFDLLRGVDVQLPTFVGGRGQSHPNMVDEMLLRGTTTGFGAGTVFVRAVLYLAFPFVEGISSRGIPVPSW